MARAYGANASLLAAFETTYGSNPVGDYWKLPFVSTTLGSEQGLIANDLIGLGRDPSAPIAFSLWLMHLLPICDPLRRTGWQCAEPGC